MKINATIGGKSYPISISCGDEESDGTSADEISTLGQLRQAIADLANLDPSASQMKIIHRGKTLTGADDVALESFKFKNNDKLIVMGKPKVAMKDDPGFNSLVAFEKKHLTELQKLFDEIGVDLSAIEQNFLEASMTEEIVKKMDKRLKVFAELSLRHLESIDGMNIIREDTQEDQAQRNREKRKSLVNGIQDLLNQNDKYIRRLDEFRLKLKGEIVE